MPYAGSVLPFLLTRTDLFLSAGRILRPDAASVPFFSGSDEPREEEEAEGDATDDDDEWDGYRDEVRGRVEDEFEDFEGDLEPRSPDDDEPSFLGL